MAQRITGGDGTVGKLRAIQWTQIEVHRETNYNDCQCQAICAICGYEI